MNGLQLILLGLSILVAAFLLWRSLRLSRQSRQRDVPGEVRAALRAREHADHAQAQNLELRLHEYGREVEGRLQTRIAVLDRLVDEADREIARLDDLLAATSATTGAKPTRQPDIVVEYSAAKSALLTNRQEAMIRHLADAGYQPHEIAHLLDRPVAAIRAALEDGSTDRLADAA